MNALSEKIFLQLKSPTEEESLGDQARIRLALETLGYEPVFFPLSVLRSLYPLCRNADFDITVTLVRRESDWAVVQVEAGDTLWSISEEYADELHYSSNKEYINEVKMMNKLRSDEIVSGQYLIVPYYSYEFVK